MPRQDAGTKIAGWTEINTTDQICNFLMHSCTSCSDSRQLLTLAGVTRRIYRLTFGWQARSGVLLFVIALAVAHRSSAQSVASVAAGGNDTMFVKTDGTLWGVGFNASGRLGDGTTIDRSTPVRVANNVASVAAGFQHSVFIRTDRTLWAVGSNQYENGLGK